jgi:AAA family ATP:ADP antiporter
MSDPAKLSPLDRSLRLFTDVRAGEGVTALLLASNVFLLLTCYYVLKSIRDGLILSEFSPEMKSYTSAAMVVVLAVVVRLYGSLADRVPRRRLINVVTVIFAACLVGFYVLAQLDVTLGIVFFVWVGVFNVMIIAQFWAFANDIYRKEEGERLFPLVAFGQSLGGVLGATVAGILIAPFGLYTLMLVGAGLLLLQVQVTNYVDTRERRIREADIPEEESSLRMTATSNIKVDELQSLLARYQNEPEPEISAEEADDEPEPADEAPSTRSAFTLVFQTRYLLMIGLLMMLLNFVNTNGEYILSRVVTESAVAAVASGQAGGLTEAEYIGTFYANFFAVVNLVGVLVQLFLVSRIVKYFGVAVGLMILPLLALGAYSLIAVYPVISYIRWAKTAENATDYSLNNTVRNMLFLPTTREQKYKGKQAIDSFFSRLGDALQAGLVLLGTVVLGLTITGFALVNLAVVVVWLLIAFMIGREYKRLVATDSTPV